MRLRIDSGLFYNGHAFKSRIESTASTRTIAEQGRLVLCFPALTIKDLFKAALCPTLFTASAAQLTAGWRPEQLKRIRPAMEPEIAAHHTAGAVTLVLRNGKISHFEAPGFAVREAGKAMKKNSVFWIAQMTTSLSATVILEKLRSEPL
ncbi:MAG: hypothetical protein ACKVHO_18070 [Verrucomicrobiia bacterium]